MRKPIESRCFRLVPARTSRQAVASQLQGPGALGSAYAGGSAAPATVAAMYFCLRCLWPVHLLGLLQRLRCLAPHLPTSFRELQDFDGGVMSWAAPLRSGRDRLRSLQHEGHRLRHGCICQGRRLLLKSLGRLLLLQRCLQLAEARATQVAHTS